MAKVIGWIGTGVMGAPMAGHLLQAGYSLRVFTRNPEKASALLAQGASWCDSPAKAAESADVVGVMVGFPEDVEQVFLGEEGILSTVRPGALLIDFTTSSPALARRVAEAAGSKGACALDAPVSGGDIGARNASLSIMVGGDATGFKEALPLLECLGKTLVHQGPAGSGQHTKMVNQIIIASTMISLCEALLYARRSGLDPELVLQSIGSGAAASWGLSNLVPRMLRQDYAPGFFVEHFVKDMGIALAESKAMGLSLPGLALAEQLYRRLVELGHAKSGTQALILALEAMNAG
ncbi:MAG: NAD(P)-dependent oxidoreductase [Verrucomicrobiota bacterium]